MEKYRRGLQTLRHCLAIGLCFYLGTTAVGCEKQKQQVNYGTVSGNVIDGSTGANLADVTIQATDSSEVTTTTDSDGNYGITGIEALDHRLEATLDGYASQFRNVTVNEETPLTDVNFVLLPLTYARDQVVIVLTWAATPSDLDSHLYVPNVSPPTHIYYVNLGNSTGGPFALLDLDDTTGSGPETTKIKMTNGSLHFSGTYRFYVHNYSQEVPFASSQAKVWLFMNGELTGTYEVTTNGTGIYWHVFDINGTTVTPFNILSTTAPPPP